MVAMILVAVFLGTACGDTGKQEVADTKTPSEGIVITPGDGIAREDLAATDGPAADAPPRIEVVLPPGFMEFCITDADCQEWGLICFEEGPVDEKPVCTKNCQENSDCPEMLVCRQKGEAKICMVAEFCDYCEDDLQCGSKGRCIQEKAVEGAAPHTFCSFPCQVDDPGSCPAGNYCKKMGSGIESYYCFPMFGACKGDGSHCMPCQSDDDCLKGHVCHENATTFERYCAKICQTKMDCPKGFDCVEEMVGEEFPLCTLEVDGAPIETCYKGNKGFCDPCIRDYECESGLCYNLPVASNYLCSFRCDKEKYAGPDGCPSGLFCAPNHGESGGDACVPPTGFGCQGFLNCLGVDCIKGEKCIDGFCQPK
jgi:hypothetical protein